MKVKARFFTRLREITDKREEEFEVENGTSMGTLLRLLEEKYGKEFKEYLRDSRGEFRESLQYLINGRNSRSLQGLETELKNGDTIAIVPPVGGG